MQDQEALREHLIRLLDWEDAHVNFNTVLSGWPKELRGTKLSGCPHTAWQLLEHLRICQWDILEFSRNPNHVPPSFPSGYWPVDEGPPNDAAWDGSVLRFQSDLNEMKGLLGDPAVNLLAPIAHGKGQTILREALLVADHNSHHLGQLIMLRRLSGTWPQRD